MQHPNPNWFAYIALFSWPLVTVGLFRAFSIVEALLWTILGAQLLLPEGTAIKVEMLPQIDKSSIASLCALIGCFVCGKTPPQARRRFGFVGILLFMYLVGPIITSSLNGDTVIIGSKVLPGVGLYDGVSATISQFLFIIPFLLGRRFIQSSSGIESILRVLVIAGMVYSLPMLFEIRMSPQLHNWIYGFFPSTFLTERRGGGFRPVVFMGLGLTAAFFTMTTCVAAAALWRAKIRNFSLPPSFATIYLSALLLLCKSTGALIYGVFLVPLIRLARPRLQIAVAIFLVTITLTYPLLRYTELFPEEKLLELASDISEDRAFSLKTRFVNEDQLLARASERVFFGWGRYGRNRIYDEDSGRDVSLTDGRWIITFGIWGFFGFAAEFGLLAYVVFCAASIFKKNATEGEKILFGATTIIVAISLFEQLPNASLSSWTWLVAGGLLGRSEMLRALPRLRGRANSVIGRGQERPLSSSI